MSSKHAIHPEPRAKTLELGTATAIYSDMYAEASVDRQRETHVLATLARLLLISEHEKENRSSRRSCSEKLN